ncbi:MAG: N-acetylglucosamine kinase [Rhodospirillales bacterium]
MTPAAGPLVLGLDGGGTATRWALRAADGTIVARGAGEGVSGHLFTADAMATARARLAAVLVEVRDAAGARPIAGVWGGITGLGRDTPVAAALAATIADLAAVPVAAVRLMGDVEVAFHAAFRPGEGHLVYAGTGSVGCHVAADGAVVTVGGRGLLIDDAGSAAWIARTALSHVLRCEDYAPGSGWSTPLGEALAGRIGGTAWDAVRAAVYGVERGAVGRLALAVGAAAGAGDPVATGILGEAGRELARLATVLIARLGPLPVALAGGAADLHPALAASLASALPAGAPLVRPTLDPAATAARLARG